MRLLRELREAAPVWLMSTSCSLGAGLAMFHPGVNAGVPSFLGIFAILFFGFYGLLVVARAIHQLLDKL